MAKIILSREEEKEIREILNQLEGYFVSFFVFTGGIGTGIFILAVLELRLQSAVIQALYGIFIISVLFCFTAGVLVLWTMWTVYCIGHGKGTVVYVKRPIRCINKAKRDLAGKQYCVFKLFGFRYAFRIASREE